ncbi:YhdP family protein [Thiomicrorhabdus sediminis]|uniref:YhdP central domain-containing protein n=1 Tax=Thiomicrorhabdus sediminis TaxID=2580412 RepID=A0A4P9K6L3_9GAMM|nr:AsmA-like C-terminal region-containing protein [Thiomicrorhabdus sediminis]QCU90695.1 hypothetical protein FE785_08670 [Thiomicrorhabdus sediminis]
MLRKTHSILQWLLAILVLYVLLTRLFVSWVQFFPQQFIQTVEAISDTKIIAEQILVEQSWDGFELTLNNFSIVDKRFVLQAAHLQTDINLFALFIPSLGYGDAIKIEYGAYQNRQQSEGNEPQPFNLQEYLQIKAVTAHLWKRIELKSFVLSEFARPGFVLHLHDFQSINAARFSVVSEFSLAYKSLLNYERFNFTASLDNDIWGRVSQGKFSLSSFSPLRVRNLSKALSKNWQSVLPRGELIVDVDGAIEDSQVTNVRLALNSQMLEWPQQTVKLPDSLGLQFDWSYQNQLALSDEDDWKIWLSKVQIDNRFIETVSPVELYYDGGDTVSFKAQFFELEPFKVLVKSLIKNPHIAAFFDQAAFLKVSDVSGRVHVDKIDVPLLSVNFERIDVPVTNYPGVSIRQLRLDKDPAGLTLRTEKPIWVMAPEVHNRPMQVKLPAMVRMNYEQDNKSWQLPRLAFQVDDAALEVEARKIASKDIDIDFNAVFNNMSSLKSYLPYPFMSETLQAFLKEGLLAGENIRFKGRVKGGYEQFPYLDKSGVFTLDAKVDNAELLFDDKWPSLKKIDAILHFTPYQLMIEAPFVEVLDGVQAKDVRVQIPDLNKDDIAVVIQANASADMKDAVNYLTSSPLAAKLGLTEFLSSHRNFHGNTRVALHKLWIPVSGYDKLETRVSGDVHFTDAGFDVLNDLPVSQLHSKLQFTESAVSAEKIRFVFMDGKVKGSLKTSASSNKALLNLNGHMLAKENTWFAEPLNWRSDWQIPMRTGRGDLKAKTTFYLGRAGSLMPKPLNKELLQDKVLTINSVLRNDDFDNRVSLPELLEAKLLWKRQDGAEKNFRLEQVIAALGGVGLKDNTRHSQIKGGIDELDLDRWLPILSKQIFNGGDASLINDLDWRGTDITVKQLDFLGQKYENQRFSWQADGLGGLSIDTIGAYLQAQALVHGDKSKPIKVNVDKLVLQTQSNQLSGSEEVVAQKQAAQCEVNIDADDSAIPNIVFSGRNIIFNGRKIDQLSFELVDEKQAFTVKTLKGGFASGAGVLSGSYQFDKYNQFSTLALGMNSNNVEGLVEFLKLNKGFTGKKADMTMELNWYGGVECLTADTANGSLGFMMKDGAIEDVEPGIARLIGLLSVESLVRRLSLDLKDVTHKGMVYDEISGKAKIDRGQVVFNEFDIKAPSASVTMQGNVDLIKEQFDLKAKVTPKIGATVPTIAAIAGAANPITALAIYTLMKVIPGVNENLVTYEYRITGPWAKPLINGKELKEAPNPVEEKRLSR